MDSNLIVIKEFYDVRAVDDTSLLRQEFGRVLSDFLEVKKIIDFR